MNHVTDELVDRGKAHRAVHGAVKAEAVPPLHAVHPRVAGGRSVGQRAARPIGGVTKRVFDIAVAATALAFLWPLMILIAIGVVLETRGPALFLQRRGGYGGRTFLIYKFRTMTALDDGLSVAQAVQGDPRVTRLGALLRAGSLDELPQILNVLRGDMSIVGPRPHAVAHDDLFVHIDPRYRMRKAARPGITGLAQVSGSRGLTADADSVRARVDCDLAYIRSWSLLGDIWIILRTAALVIHDPRAV